jgi:YD repeat-containing protein
MPLQYPFQVCAGDCPRPCRSVTNKTVATFTYDSAGNWLTTKRGEDTDACEHLDGRIATCGDGYEQWMRRGDGRLLALEMGSNHERWMTVTYDKNGDTTGLAFPGFSDNHRFVYDSAHRMLEHHWLHDGDQVSTYAYTGDGRLASETNDMGIKRFSYDDRGRLARVANFPAPGNDIKDVVKLEYDDRDRIIKVIEDPRYYGGPITTTYDYDCR